MHEKYTYRTVWSDDDNQYVGLCTEFPSLSWLADSHDEAFEGIRRLVADVVKDMQKNNEVVPEALSTKKFSGKFVIRITPEMHRQLTRDAMEAHVSLNRYVCSKLSNG